jgi:hypothetical protein
MLGKVIVAFIISAVTLSVYVGYVVKTWDKERGIEILPLVFVILAIIGFIILLFFPY